MSFKVFRSNRTGRYGWRIVARNGRVVAQAAVRFSRRDNAVRAGYKIFAEVA